MLAFPTAISFDFNLHELSGGGKKLAFPNSQIHRVNLVCYFFWFHEMSGVEKMLAFPYFKFIE